MRPLALAKKYIDCVFFTANFDQLRSILADDLRFTGPYYSFNNADDYLNSLKADPPRDFKYQIIKTFEDKSSACLVYDFSKPGVSTTMMQLFETKTDKITRILLIFDSAAFEK